MRYCISDPHGEYALFCKLLETVGFSDADELIVCGDILDKGPEPIRLAKLIFSLPNARCIVGNHEYEFLKFYWSLMKDSPNDFDAVLSKLRAYVRDGENLLDWDTVDRIENMPFYLEDGDFICVHAGVPLTADGKFVPLERVTASQFVYDRNFKDPSVLPKGEKCVFFGHTPTNFLSGHSGILTYPRTPAPKSVADYYKIHLDTGANLNGLMGSFCIDTLETRYVRRSFR